MARPRIPAEIEHRGAREVQRHPAFAMIGASRVTGRAALFGSDFEHHHYVTITVHEAEAERDLSHDWIHPTKVIAEVALSEAQWATFVSTPNVGHGVPATLRWSAEKGGHVPGIEREPDIGNRAQFREEVGDHLADAIHQIDLILGEGKVRKADRERLEHVRRQLAGNMDFVVKSFDEHAEKTVEKVKIEVSAYMEAMVRNAGLEALGASLPVTMIGAGGGVDEEHPYEGD